MIIESESLRARTGAPLGLAPRRDRVTATGGLALATAERVVDGVHRDAARLGALPLPAVAAGLADLDQLVLGVAHDPERRPTVDRDAPHLGGGEAQRGKPAVLRDELDAHARAPGHLAAAAGAQLHVVDDRAGRDVAHRERIADADVRAVARLDHVADREAVRGEDVALLAVQVVQEGDAARAVGVVLDVGDLGRDAVLVPTEVHDAVLLLVPAAAVPRRLAPVDVAAAGLRLRCEQAALGPGAGELGEVRDRLEATARAGGLAGAECHQFLTTRTGRSCCRRRASRSRASVSSRRPTRLVLRLRTVLPLRRSVLTLATLRRTPARRRGARRSWSRRCRPRRHRRALSIKA